MLAVAAPIFLVEMKADDLLVLTTNANACGGCSYFLYFLVETKADRLLVLTTNACDGGSYFLVEMKADDLLVISTDDPPKGIHQFGSTTPTENLKFLSTLLAKLW